MKGNYRSSGFCIKEEIKKNIFKINFLKLLMPSMVVHAPCWVATRTHENSTSKVISSHQLCNYSTTERLAFLFRHFYALWGYGRLWLRRRLFAYVEFKGNVRIGITFYIFIYIFVDWSGRHATPGTAP